MARYLARLDEQLRPQLDERITELGVTPKESIHSTLSFDTITGGAATNIVPDRCVVTFNRRLLPGEALDKAREELLAPLDELNLRWDYRETYATEPTLVDENEPVVQAACRAVRRLGLNRRSSSRPAATTSASSSTAPGSPTRSSTAPARPGSRTSPTSTSRSTTSCSAPRAWR